MVYFNLIWKRTACEIKKTNQKLEMFGGGTVHQKDAKKLRAFVFELFSFRKQTSTLASFSINNWPSYSNTFACPNTLGKKSHFTQACRRSESWAWIKMTLFVNKNQLIRPSHRSLQATSTSPQNFASLVQQNNQNFQDVVAVLPTQAESNDRISSWVIYQGTVLTSMTLT